MAYTTINDPEKYFQCVTYTGNGSSRTISYPNADADLDADLIWIKQRDGDATSHTIFDTVRGAQKAIFTNNTNAEATRTDAVSAFDTDDFDLGSNGDLNSNTQKYIAWCWKESADAGFDIVSYTGNATNRTISHSLSAVPHWMVVKNRDSTVNWTVYHHKNTSAPETDRLLLNTTDATGDSDAEWNDTAPTSSVFSVGTGDSPNKSGDAMIAYLWTEKKGYSKFGSFEGNNNADGSFVYLGFKPRWVIIKDIDSSNTVGGSAATSWGIWDSKRMPGNPASNPLWANKDTRETIRGNASSANTGGSDGNGLGGFIHLDMLSNGFKCRCATGELNDAQTYVYMAFAEAPFVNSNGVPCNAK